MTVAFQSDLFRKLKQCDQKDWEMAVLELREEMHPVDRDATWIWFSFWPLKLCDALQNPEGHDDLVREWRLRGGYRLSDQLDESVSFLFGSRWWPQVTRAVLSAPEHAEPFAGIGETVRRTAARLASQVGVSKDLLTGISAVGWMALRQVGPESLSKVGAAPAGEVGSADDIVERRALERKPGLWERLVSGADRRHRVVFDEVRRDGFFKARESQDLSMASRSDTRDYRSEDPRRTEGPIPFECRSGSCGHCWIGILGGRERLEEQTEYERERLRYFGYLSPHVEAESHPVIRLACQAQCHGDVIIVIPPWNGTLEGRL